MDVENINRDKKQTPGNYLKLFLCGATAGASTFGLAYPADQLRTRMMVY